MTTNIPKKHIRNIPLLHLPARELQHYRQLLMILRVCSLRSRTEAKLLSVQLTNLSCFVRDHANLLYFVSSFPPLTQSHFLTFHRQFSRSPSCSLPLSKAIRELLPNTEVSAPTSVLCLCLTDVPRKP